MSSYELCEGGHWYCTISGVESAKDAIKEAIDNVDDENYYHGRKTTMWIDVRARNVDDPSDEETATVRLDPSDLEALEAEARADSDVLT